MKESADRARRSRAWGWAAIILLFCGLCWSISLQRSGPARVVVNRTTAETLQGDVDGTSRQTEFVTYVEREVEVLKEREGKVSKKLQAEKTAEVSDCRQRIERVENEKVRARENGAFSERMMLETRQELSSIAKSLVALEL